MPGACTGTVSGSATVNVSGPVASIPNDTTFICSGGIDTVTVSFSGGGPYTFVYSINNVDQPAITTNGPTYDLSFSLTSGGDTIRLVSLSSPACTGAVSGLYIVKVAPFTATISGDTTVCSVGAGAFVC